MGEIVVPALLAAIVLTAIVTLAYVNRPTRELDDAAGTWNIAEFSGVAASQGFTRICLIRKDGDRETGRIVVRTIDDGAEDWTQQYEEAMSEARQRLLSMQGHN